MKVRNISKKPYTHEGSPKHYLIQLTDPDCIFEQLAQENHTLQVSLEPLAPGETTRMEKIIKVSGSPSAYSENLLKLEMTSIPTSSPEDTAKACSLITHELHFQISVRYEYNPASQFLIVVNCATYSPLIQGVTQYIRDALHLEMDIYNLSLNGSFIDTGTSQNVLHRYEGKSVIVFANHFPYYQSEKRIVWDLLDPWEVCRLAKAGTNFTFLGALDTDSRQLWMQMLKFAVSSIDPASATHHADLDELIKELSTSRSESRGTHGKETMHRFNVPQRSWLNSSLSFWPFKSTPEDQLLQSAQTSADRLNAVYPLRRFLLSPAPEYISEKHDTKESVLVIEGLPFMTNVRASRDYLNKSVVTEHCKYMIISSLPFETRIRMFWNLASTEGTDAVEFETLYTGIQHMDTSKANTSTTSKYNNQKVKSFIINPSSHTVNSSKGM